MIDDAKIIEMWPSDEGGPCCDEALAIMQALQGEVDHALAALLLQIAEKEYVYECARRRLQPRWDDLPESIRQEWIEEARTTSAASLLGEQQ